MDFCTFNFSARPLLANSLRGVWHILILLALSLGFLHTSHAQTIGVIADGQDIFQGTNFNGNNPRGSITKCTGCHTTAANSNTGNNNGTGSQKIGNGVDWNKIYAANIAQADMNKYLPGGTIALTDVDLKNLSAYICSQNTAATKPPTCNAPVTVTPSKANISPNTTINFGTVVQGASSAPTQVVTLSNSGGTALVVSTVALTGGTVADYVMTNNCAGMILAAAVGAASGGSCTINLNFKPNASSGTITTSVVVTHNSGGVANSTSMVALSGVASAAAAAKITLIPASLVFGTVTALTGADTKTIVITNSGTAPLTGLAFSLSGTDAASFKSPVVHNCPASLAASSACTVSVTYAPLTAGAKSAALSIASNLAAVSVPLTGSADNAVPALSLSSTSIKFGKQTVGSIVPPTAITLSSNGTGDVVFGATPFTSGNAALQTAHNCPVTLKIGTSCTLTVTFVVPSTPQLITSTVTVNSNAVVPAVIAVTGESVALPATPYSVIGIAPTALTYAPQIINSPSVAQAVTVSNNGSATLNVTAISLSGGQAADFSLTTGASSCSATFPFTLAAKSGATVSSCMLYIIYKPFAAAASAATLNVTSDSTGGNSSISLSGTGLSVPVPKPSLNTGVMSYAGVVGSQSGQLTATLTNLGNASLTGTWKITGSGDFIVLTGGTSCLSTGYTLATNANCSVYVAYAPIASGASTATLTFVTNSSIAAEVSLLGNASAKPEPVANLSSTGSGAYASVQINKSSTTQSFVLSNQGGAAALLPGAPVITGPDMADFTLVNLCPPSVAAGQTCTIDVSFKPSHPGAHAAMLEVPTNAATGTATMALSGDGSAAPVVSTSSTSGSAVVPATQSGGGGGCATGNSHNGLLDPTLWLLCLVSLILLVRRHQASTRD